MTFYRHFVERDDFEIEVATNYQNFPFDAVSYKSVRFSFSRIVQRLFRTRLMPWLYGPYLLKNLLGVPSNVLNAASQFRPDAVFTVAGTWDYSTLLAERVARQLGVPLIASFNDWYNYGWFPPHQLYHGMIEKKFRRFYSQADLALCTCEGMKDALGDHKNVHVLYPIGGHQPLGESGHFKPFVGGRKVIVGFAGNLGEWYGPMVTRLVASASAQKLPIEFRIYGRYPTLERGFLKEQNDVFKGHLPAKELCEAMNQVDILLLPMGFEERAALIEATSFKTKFLDYLTYRKPILVWGPEYCSAVRVAREFDSAEICNTSNESAALSAILSLARSEKRQAKIVENSQKMYDGKFNPDTIHSAFVKKCRELIAASAD